MTVTYLPHTHDISDEAVKQNFEYLESHGLFLDDNLASIANKATAIDNLGALDAAENLADLASIATALTNLGLPDATGKAPFLQLLSAQKLQLAFGVATLTWPGGQNQANVVTQAHGLGGRVPKFFGAFPQGLAPGGISFYMFSQNAPDVANIYLYARANAGANPGAGNAGDFCWWAVG